GRSPCRQRRRDVRPVAWTPACRGGDRLVRDAAGSGGSEVREIPDDPSKPRNHPEERTTLPGDLPPGASVPAAQGRLRGYRRGIRRAALDGGGEAGGQGVLRGRRPELRRLQGRDQSLFPGTLQ